MKKLRENIIFILLSLNYFIFILFDNEIININILHRLIFSFSISVLFIVLLVSAYKNSKVHLNIKFISLIVFFLFSLFISSFINNKLVFFFESFSLYLNLFIFAIIVIISFHLFNESKIIGYISNSILISGLIYSIIGITEIFGISIIKHLPGINLNTNQLVRNFASEILIGVLPFTLYNVFRNKNKYSIYFSAISAFIILCNLFLLRKRTTYIAIIISIICFLLFLVKYYKNDSSRFNYKKIYLSAIILLIISFAVGFIPVEKIDGERKSIFYTINSTWDLSNTSNSTRILYWKSSLDMFYNNPIWGIGTGNWFAVYPEKNGNLYNDENVNFNDDLNPHNDYLRILSENGLIGFLIFLALFIYILFYLIRMAYSNIDYIPVCLSFICLSVFSFFSFPADNVSAMIIYFTAIGIGLKNNKDGMNIKNIQVKFLLIPFFIILIIISAYNFKRYESEKVYLLAMQEKSKGNYSDMINKLNSINLQYYPVDANKVALEFYKGTGYFDLNEYEKSLECFQKCMELTPYSPSLINNLASVYYMTGNFPKSDSLLSIEIKKCPGYIEPEINLLAMYANKGKDSLARNIIIDINNKKFNKTKVKSYLTFLRIQDFYEKKSN